MDQSLSLNPFEVLFIDHFMFLMVEIQQELLLPRMWVVINFQIKASNELKRESGMSYFTDVEFLYEGVNE